MFLVGIVTRQSRQLGNIGVYHVMLRGNERENDPIQVISRAGGTPRASPQTAPSGAPVSSGASKPKPKPAMPY